MVLPHEDTFRLWRPIFWGGSAAGLVLAARVPGLPAAQRTWCVLGAVLVAPVLYLYTRWLTRHDARFRHVHPRKIHASGLVSFYLPLGAALLVLVSAAWLDSPRDRVLALLAVPCLLAAAAGARRGMA